MGVCREQRDDGLDAYDLATRLAYMLTVRPPDNALLAAAANGSLLKPETVRVEAERLLKTPHATFAITHFAHQWLGTRILPKVSPDPLLGPFTEQHRKGLMDEIERTVNEALDKNLPLGDLIDPDFTSTNTSVNRDMYAKSDPLSANGVLAGGGGFRVLLLAVIASESFRTR